jgi:CRP-like cAMP-binding protein
MKDFLRTHIEKISPLIDKEYDYIKTHFSSRKLKKHQFLVQQGEDVLNDYLVVSGCLKAYLIDANGKEHILQFATEDWWITDYQAYFYQTKATVFVDCIEDCEVLVLSLFNREKICADLHKIDHFFRKKSNLGYVALQQRILTLLNNSPKERYEKLLGLYPDLFQRVPKTLIAAYLGVSRETLSRLNSK